MIHHPGLPFKYENIKGIGACTASPATRAFRHVARVPTLLPSLSPLFPPRPFPTFSRNSPSRFRGVLRVSEPLIFVFASSLAT